MANDQGEPNCVRILLIDVGGTQVKVLAPAKGSGLNRAFTRCIACVRTFQRLGYF
jgi:hypothetical protein